MRAFIPKSDLIHSAYYAGECRNASTARWNAETGLFYYRRTKFGDSWVESICHPSDDNGFDLFYPHEVLLDHEPIDWTEAVNYDMAWAAWWNVVYKELE